MKPRQSDTDTGILSTRRDFLKSTGVAAAALAGSLGARADNGSMQCGFAELPPDLVYLNTGTEGSMPSCVMSTLEEGLRTWANDPTISYEVDPVLGKNQPSNREKAAAFFNVRKNNVCLTDNTTMGLSMTLMGLNFHGGDRVVTTNHEHTAMRSPLRVLQERLGITIETRSFPAAETLSGMDSTELLDTLFPDLPVLRGAKALCVSHVYPSTGVRLPLAALREKTNELGIRYLVVDGAQAMGMLDLTGSSNNLKDCDFYAGPGHKWLNGPPGTGVLYIRNENIQPPEFYPMISQRMEKYADCRDESDVCFPVVEALQVRGCSNTPGFTAMIRAMAFANDAGGPAQIEKHILRLSRKVKDGILARAPHCIVSPHSDDDLSSGLTVFFPFRWDRPQVPIRDDKTADWVVRKLLDRNIQVRSIGVANRNSSHETFDISYAVRVSTGHFNSADEIDIFEAALQEILMQIR